MVYQPYTYLIGWTQYDKWYYGSEYASVTKIANPQNLWKIYFTSSIEVEKMREMCGEPDVVQVRRIFQTAKDAVTWENTVLRRLHVIESDRWLNKNDGRKEFLLGMKGKVHSFETKEKMRQKASGRQHTSDTKVKISRKTKGVSRPTPWLKGRKQSSELIAKRVASNIGKKRSPEQRALMKNRQEQRRLREGTKRKFLSTFIDVNDVVLAALGAGT